MELSAWRGQHGRLSCSPLGVFNSLVALDQRQGNSWFQTGWYLLGVSSTRGRCSPILLIAQSQRKAVALGRTARELHTSKALKEEIWIICSFPWQTTTDRYMVDKGSLWFLKAGSKTFYSKLSTNVQKNQGWPLQVRSISNYIRVSQCCKWVSWWKSILFFVLAWMKNLKVSLKSRWV